MLTKAVNLDCPGMIPRRVDPDPSKVAMWPRVPPSREIGRHFSDSTIPPSSGSAGVTRGARSGLGKARDIVCFLLVGVCSGGEHNADIQEK
jgi:hypothetical protein